MYSTQDDDRMCAMPDAEAGEFDIDEFACFGLRDDEEEDAVADYDFSETPAQAGLRVNITNEQEAAEESALTNQPLHDIRTPVTREGAAFPIYVVYNARAYYMPEGVRALRLSDGDDHFVLEAIARAERPFKETLRFEFLLPVQFSMQRASSVSPNMYVLVNGVDRTSAMPRAYMQEGSRVLTWEWTPPASSDISMVMLRLPVEVEGDLPAAGARTTVRVTYGNDTPIVAAALAMPALDYRSAERVRLPLQVISIEAEPDAELSVAARARAARRAAASLRTAPQAVPAAATSAFAAAPAAARPAAAFAAAPAQPQPSASAAAAYATPRRAVTASVTAPMAATLPATAPVIYPAALIPQMEVYTMSELPPIMTNPDAFNPDGSSVYGDRIRFIRSEETVERDTMLSPGQIPAPATIPALPQGPSEFQSRIIFRRAFPG